MFGVGRVCDKNRKIKLICLGKKGLSYFTRHNYNIIFGRQAPAEVFPLIAEWARETLAEVDV